MLLTRLTRSCDIPIGTVSDGRADPALDNVVGAFANPVVLRIDTAGTPTFGELVARVRATALAADRHRHLPFDRLVDEIQPDCPPSRHPLFQVSVDLRPATDEPVDIPFDLDLTVAFDRSTGGSAELRYSTDLFEHPTAARIRAALVDVLTTVAADPTVPVSVEEPA